MGTSEDADSTIIAMWQKVVTEHRERLATETSPQLRKLFEKLLVIAENALLSAVTRKLGADRDKAET